MDNKSKKNKNELNETNQVTKQDQHWFDEHVLSYSDDYRFNGYKSEPKALLERSLAASALVRGAKLDVVDKQLDRQHEILERKTTALVNILSQNDDKAYHIDNHVVTSYVTKMLDDYAVGYMIADASESMHTRFFDRYLEDNDPELMHTVLYLGDPDEFTFSFGEAYDTKTNDELIDRINKQHSGVYMHDNYDKDEFGYVIEGDEEADEIREIALYRGVPVAKIISYNKEDENGEPSIEFDKDSKGQTSFKSFTETDESNPGIYKIENGDVYRYNQDETMVQKITGEDSVREVEELMKRSSRLNDYRKFYFSEILDTIDTRTGRLNDFDFTSIESDLDKTLTLSTPGFEPVDKHKEKDVEDDLEL